MPHQCSLSVTNLKQFILCYLNFTLFAFLLHTVNHVLLVMTKKKSFTPTREPKRIWPGKQRRIAKLIDNAKGRAVKEDTLGTPTVGPLPALSEERKVRLPQAQVIAPPVPSPSITFVHPPQPKSTSKGPDLISSGYPKEDFLVLCRRQEKNALAFLPKKWHIERASKYIPKGHFPFLELPGELRNKIYDYAIPCESYVLDWVNHKQKSHSLTYRLPYRGKAFAPRLDSAVVERRRATRNLRNPVRGIIMQDVYRGANAVSLLWVCRKMYPEAASMFYSKSTFIFTHLGTLRHFLNNLTATDKAAITRLTLKYQTYGHPAKTENAVFKQKHDKSWEDLCWRVADECPSLTNLVLDLNLKRCPITFGPLEAAHLGGFTTKWMQALWAFEDRNLKRLGLRLRSGITSSAVLEVESQNLRKSLLGEAWDEEAETKRDAFGYEQSPPKKKGIILRLAGEDLVGAR